MILKNVASQGTYLFAYDTTNNVAKAGDASNITGFVSKDGAAEAGFATANPTEIGGGIYWQPLSQGETNANMMACRWQSSTAGVRIDPVITNTSGVNLPAVAPGANNGFLVVGTGTGGINPANGRVVLTSAGLDQIVIETGLNARQAISIIAAIAAGAVSGTESGAPVFKGAGVTTTRATAVVSGDNRTSVTLSPPA